ncbi:hypothetical protein D917_05456 [Trichinella nativa]|uniref:Uncharacterized protein n=1 Tax=Trichinella nativa TaxID=6335 RepID=A0A1Y3F230_9BILA|nr:hypothetical protein D917_05456 [Trichinella nativa]
MALNCKQIQPSPIYYFLTSLYAAYLFISSSCKLLVISHSAFVVEANNVLSIFHSLAESQQRSFFLLLKILSANGKVVDCFVKQCRSFRFRSIAPWPLSIEPSSLRYLNYLLITVKLPYCTVFERRSRSCLDDLDNFHAAGRTPAIASATFLTSSTLIN